MSSSTLRQRGGNKSSTAADAADQKRLQKTILARQQQQQQRSPKRGWLVAVLVGAVTCGVSVSWFGFRSTAAGEIPKRKSSTAKTNTASSRASTSTTHTTVDSDSTVDDTKQQQQQQGVLHNFYVQEEGITNDATWWTRPGSYEILEKIPHDPAAFTQGLVRAGGASSTTKDEYYESTGLYGNSTLRRCDGRTGAVVQQIQLDDAHFGEGLTISHHWMQHHKKSQAAKDVLVQLTWKEKIGLVYDMDTLQPLDSFTYDTHTGEGWGITTRFGQGENSVVSRAEEWVVSDGSEFLYVWDVTGKEKSRTPVLFRPNPEAETKPIGHINELQWDAATQTVLANVWFQEMIVRIHVETGRIARVYDMSGLERPKEADCLNGILEAHQADDDEPYVFWVTGKLWPDMYKVRLIDIGIQEDEK